MLYSPLVRGPSILRRVVVLTAVVGMLVLGLAASAGAVISTDGACPDPGDAGFLDILQYPRDVRDAINCLAEYGIAEGTSSTTFSAATDVTRWQMALFLIRQAEAHGVTLPSGTGQGFNDIGGLPLSTQLAINRLVQLGITEGIGAGLFAPDTAVPRWQMALFLTRLLDAAGLTLPSGADQGFTDIGVFPTATEKAINQLAQLDVTEGTGLGKFSPDLNVTRWQMALFLTRTLEADGVTPATFPGGGGTKSVPKVGAPDLTNVRRTGEDTVLELTRVAFQFDEDVALKDKTDLLLVAWDGTLIPATAAKNNPDNTKEVLADYDTDDYRNSVAGAVTPGAVVDIEGLENTMGSYAISLARGSIRSLDWPADLPELTKVTVDAAADQVTFTFDQKIDESDSQANFAGFRVVLADGTEKPGEAYNSTSDDDDVKIKVTLTTSEASDVVRAYVLPGAADADTGAGTRFNQRNVIDVSGASDSGVPDLVSAKIVDAGATSKQMEFTFSTSVQNPDASKFELIFANDPASPQTGTAAVVKSSDAKTVQVTFGSQLDSDLVLYAHALPEAVQSFPQLIENAMDGVKLGPYSFSAGRTAGPDLLSSVGTKLGLSQEFYRIVFTFDEDLDDTNAAFTFSPATDLLGWDEDGELVDISGGSMTIEDEVMTIEFDETDTGFDELKDGDVVRFGVYADEIADEFGFTSYPDGVGCDCRK